MIRSFNGIAVVLFDFLAAKRAFDSQLVVGQRKRFRDDHHTADLLVATEVVQLTLRERPPLRWLIVLERSLRHDQSSQKVTAISNDHALVNLRRRKQAVLNQTWVNILAPVGDDQFFFSTGERQEPIRIEDTRIPGPEPIPIKDSPRPFLVLVIAHHDILPSGKNLVVFRKPDLDARSDSPHGSEFHLRGR